MSERHTLRAMTLIALLGGLGTTIPCAAQTDAPNPATKKTIERNLESIADLDFQNREDFALATRGTIEATPGIVITDDRGNVVWDMASYSFVQGAPPLTVNPSLWRNAQLNMNAGLYQVAERIYQVRGYDLSNMTIVDGSRGVVIIDPLVTPATAKAALKLFYKNRPKSLPVAAVIYTHSHIDHYGGVRGIVSNTDVKNGIVKIYAPPNFLEDAISENVYAGNAMSRRSQYMYGMLAGKSATGQVDAGLGKTTSLGESSIIPPTHTIQRTGDAVVIGGEQFVFQLTPNTEAPTEMNFYLPKYKALCMAENATPTLHNRYTLRGAQVRDAKAWMQYLRQAADLFPDAEALFASHFWPRWGNRQIKDFIAQQADLYQYLHDQSLRMANQGYTLTEIAERMVLPKSLRDKFHLRGYYGTVNHDAKAVYQRYLGWFDGNPSNLHALPPEEAGKRYVEFMGGADALLSKAQTAYDNGDYRWVAQVVSHLVFSDPGNQQAKSLEANALEQLGYQSESGPWRNFYLVGAKELRTSIPRVTGSSASPDVIAAMSSSMLFDYIGIRLDGPKAEGKTLAVNVVVSDTHERFGLILRNSVLPAIPTKGPLPGVWPTMTLTHAALADLAFTANPVQRLSQPGITITGNAMQVQDIFSLLVDFTPDFGVVTPAPPPDRVDPRRSKSY